MSELARVHASLVLLSLSIGCNALFDIERGTPAEAASSSGTTGNGGSGGSGGGGGSGGSAGSSSGNAGSSAGGSGGNGTSSTSGGNGGSDTTGANGGNGGSSGGGGATSSTGGASTTAGAGGASVESVSCACSSTTPDDASLIDDFEDGDAAILERSGRQGGYYYGLPAEYASGARLDCDTGEDGNCVALCMQGVLDGDNYPFAGMGVTLLGTDDGAEPYDLSSFAGISFKLKGTLPPDVVLRTEFPTVLTHPTMYGGTCEGDGCFDHYKVAVPAPMSESTFEEREVRFVTLGQGNGGGAWTEHYVDSVEAAWDPSQLLNINWQVASTVQSLSSAPFSFCIDDIHLLEPDTAELIASWDFETDVLDVGRVDANVTISQSNAMSALGEHSLQAEIQTGGAWGCAPGDCWMLDATACAATSGCHSVDKSVFALNDANTPIDMQPGDRISIWFYLPSGDIEWVNVFIAAGAMHEWSVFPLSFPAKRNGWYYAEFIVPDSTETPVHEWGIELGAAPGFTGSVYVDQMSIHRP